MYLRVQHKYGPISLLLFHTKQSLVDEFGVVDLELGVKSSTKFNLWALHRNQCFYLPNVWCFEHVAIVGK